MSLRRILLFGFVMLLLVGLGASNFAIAGAEGGGVQLTVNTLADTTSTCSQNGNGTCSLRDLLTFANNAGGGTPIIIYFSVTGTVNLTANLPSIKYDVKVDGSNQVVTIHGQSSYRIFTVNRSGIATINALTLTNGYGIADCNSNYTCGGAIKNRGTLTVSDSVIQNSYAEYTGGAIFNDSGTLTVTNTTFANNSTSQFYGLGGAIYNAGSLSITNNSAFNNNTGFVGGAIYHQIGSFTLDDATFQGNGNTSADGGAIYSQGNLVVTDTLFAENELDQASTGAYGGAIHNDGGTLTVNNSTFTNNSTSPFGYGGAIANGGAAAVKNSTLSGNYAEYGGALYNLNGTLTVLKSTIASNTGWGDGGGLYNDHGTLNITNSTITENTAEGANGGGIYNYDGALTVINSTVYHNHSASIIHYAGGIYNDGTSVTLKNTVVANNSANQCYDYADSLTADAYNIDDDGTCGNATQHTVSDIALLALTKNGGPTQTMKPAARSVLRNAGDDAVCAAAPVNAKDQRGVTRPQGTHCDVGAYEAKAK